MPFYASSAALRATNSTFGVRRPSRRSLTPRLISAIDSESKCPICRTSRPMADILKHFCENLWRDWLTGNLEATPSVGSIFDLSAAPEPYLIFGQALNPFVVLTTNPGRVMDHQLLATVLRGNGPL